MPMTLLHRRLIWLLLIAAGVWPAACSSTPVTARSVAPVTGVHRIVLIPFADLTEVYGESGLIQCPLNPKYFQAGTTADGAEQSLTALTRRQMLQVDGFETALWNRKLAGVSLDRWRSKQEREFAVRVGRETGADAVLIGYLYRYRHRVGEKYSAETPAAVSFSVHLLRTETGEDLWYGFFEESQQALSENLFRLPLFLHRGASWQTAEELARYGLTELWKSFPEKP